MSRVKGTQAEGLAVRYLENKGYNIVEQNYYSRFGEIDIVAMQGDVIVFVEVKSGKKQRDYRPIESITRAKLRKLLKTIEIYLNLHKLYDRDIRVDGLEIIFDYGDSYEITHYESITY